MGELAWRLVLDDPLPGPDNMARDHALAELLEPGTGVLRLYRWERPTVSFGRNEPARDRYDSDLGSKDGLAFVRRPTGGRAVLHHRELTYAVVVPLRSLGGLREGYRRINEALVTALSALGAPVAMAGDEAPSPGPGAGPCFNGSAPGEVTAEGRKLVGSAQVRIGDALLQHGSILLDGDQRALARLSGGERPSAADPATLAGVLGSAPSWRRVADEVGGSFRSLFGGSWETGDLTAGESEGAARLRRERYASEEWTWRR